MDLCEINPSTGLPMVTDSIDVGGNFWGQTTSWPTPSSD